MEFQLVFCIVFLLSWGNLVLAYHCDQNFDSKHGGQTTKLKCVQTSLKEVSELQNMAENTTKLILQHTPAKMKTISRSNLGKMQGLKDLEIVFSKIKHLDGGAFADAHSLLKVTIKTSLLKNIPAKLFENSTVRYFTLGETKSLTVPERKPLLESEILEALAINACRVRAIYPETFGDLPNLNALSLKNNRLSAIPKNAFANNPHLRLVQLQGNRLNTLSLDAFRTQYDRKISLFLKKNQWNCDCGLKALVDWEFSSINKVSTLKCKVPNEMLWETALASLNCSVSK